MSPLARVVVAAVPHHVTERGNRRQVTFLKEEDHPAYLRDTVYVPGPAAEVKESKVRYIACMLLAAAGFLVCLGCGQTSLRDYVTGQVRTGQ